MRICAPRRAVCDAPRTRNATRLRLRNSASFGEADLVTACLSGVEKPLRQTNHTQQARGARQAVNRSAGF
jgi:hypothetical protein